jgi:hypothetical protein
MVKKAVTLTPDGSVIAKSDGTPWTARDIHAIGYSLFGTIEYHEFFNWLVVEFATDNPERAAWAERMLKIHGPCNGNHLDASGMAGIAKMKKEALENRDGKPKTN